MAAPAPPARNIKQDLGLLGQATLLQIIKVQLDGLKNTSHRIINHPENPNVYHGPRMWKGFARTELSGLGITTIFMRWSEYEDKPPEWFRMTPENFDDDCKAFLKSLERLDGLTSTGARTFRNERTLVMNKENQRKMDFRLEFIIADPLDPEHPFNPENKA